MQWLAARELHETDGLQAHRALFGERSPALLPALDPAQNVDAKFQPSCRLTLVIGQISSTLYHSYHPAPFGVMAIDAQACLVKGLKLHGQHSARHGRRRYQLLHQFKPVEQFGLLVDCGLFQEER